MQMHQREYRCSERIGRRDGRAVEGIEVEVEDWRRGAEAGGGWSKGRDHWAVREG